MQLYLPLGQFRDLILRECHDTRYVGHLGVRKTGRANPEGFLLANGPS